MGSMAPDEPHNPGPLAFLMNTNEEEAELNEAFTMCFHLIDQPPDEYRYVFITSQ